VTLRDENLCCLIYCSICEWSAEIDEVCEPRCPACDAKRVDMRIQVGTKDELEEFKKKLGL